MPAHGAAGGALLRTVSRAACARPAHGGFTVVPTEVLLSILRFAFDRDAYPQDKRADHAVATLLRVSRVCSKMRRVVHEFASSYVQSHARFHLWPRVHSAAKTLHDTEHGMVHTMDADKKRRHVLLHHLRAVPGDLVGMDAIFVLPEQYRARKETPAHLHVRSWRVIHFTRWPTIWHAGQLKSVSKCICYDLPFKAEEGIVILEAVDISTPQNVVFDRQMPPVRLTMRGVSVQASLDNLSRLCFLQRTICTVCCFREAKHESLETCSKPNNKRCFAKLCDACCKELFVVVQKCQTFDWKAPKWVLDLEAKDELYFLSRVQEPVGVFGHPKTPNCGIYALKHEAALAQGFASWSALFVHEQQQRSARRRARKSVR